MPYWRLFYHIVWSTRGREPLLDEEDERIVVRSVRTTLPSFKAILHAVGVMPDSVHVAASIPPSVALSEVVGRMKGASAHALSHAPRSRVTPFAWQGEHGVLSLGEGALPEVVAYVRNQREHHAAQRLGPSLERVAEQADDAAAGGR